jgi:hypothetical protein
VVLAARGARNLDSGEEKIDNGTVARHLRRLARRVQVKSFLAAAMLTGEPWRSPSG